LKRYWGEIKDPVHGYVYITEVEKKLIDSYPFQRLRRLRQLAGSEFVYSGANHTRFEHCIGVMHLAGKLSENQNLSQYLSDDEIQIVRMASLLHDVGHGPFSHIFEYLLVKIKAIIEYVLWFLLFLFHLRIFQPYHPHLFHFF